MFPMQRLFIIVLLAVLVFSACQPIQPTTVDPGASGNYATGAQWPILLTDDPQAMAAAVRIGSEGSLTCTNLNGFALDSVGNLMVVDAPNGQIRQYDSTGRWVTAWGQPGRSPGEFNFQKVWDQCAVGNLAVAADGAIYVVDSGNQRVQKFDQAGHFVLAWGSKGFKAGQFATPFGIAVNSQGEVYVVDALRSDVQKFAADGAFLLRFGGSGSLDGKFSTPWYIAIDGEDNVYVTDWTTNRVQKFDAAGRFLTKWGEAGKAGGQFDGPVGLAADRARGFLYVVDWGNSRVQQFDTAGQFLTAWGERGAAGGQLANPYQVAVDSRGAIYVGDQGGVRIQKFDQPQ